jgi:isochorismate hydrolase
MGLPGRSVMEKRNNLMSIEQQLNVKQCALLIIDMQNDFATRMACLERPG